MNKLPVLHIVAIPFVSLYEKCQMCVISAWDILREKEENKTKDKKVTSVLFVDTWVEQDKVRGERNELKITVWWDIFFF